MESGQAALAEALALFSAGLLREESAPEDALDAYRRALSLAPSYELLYARAALLLIQLGRFDPALTVMEDGCRANPRSASACLYLAQVAQALQKPEAALAAARRAMDLAPDDARGYLQTAALLLAAPDEPSAVKVLESARGRAADARPVLRALADLYIRRAADGDPAATGQAIACLAEAEAMPADEASPACRERLADLYLLSRQPDRALDVLLGLSALKPDDETLQRKLALCYLALGRTAQAVETMKRALGSAPDSAMLHTYLGELYEKLGDASHALASFRSAIDTPAGPSSAQPFLKLAAYYLEPDPALAVRTLQRGLRQFPDEASLLELLVQAALRDNRPREALDSFERLVNALQRQGGRLPAPRMYVEFGLLAQQQDQPGRAEVLYEAALEQDPGLLEAWLRLSFLYALAGDADRALACLDEAVTRQPDDPLAWYYFGLLHHRADEPAVALRAFEHVEALAGRAPRGARLLDSAFYFHYGSACERAGQIARAEGLLARSIALDTANAEAFNYLAYMWAERGQHLDTALEYVRHALDWDPESAAFLDTRGWIEYRQGRHEDARRTIEEALVFEPGEPTILEHYGDVLAALGRIEEALAAWRRGLAAAPGNQALADKVRASARAGAPAPIHPAPRGSP